MTQLVEALFCKPEGRGVRLECFIDTTVRQHYDLEVPSISDSNEYQEYFLGE